MKAYRYFTLAVFAGSVLAVLAPNARAQAFSERMKVTFSGPVEVPGTVLPAGSYVFESLDSRHMTRILKADGSDCVATVFTVPEERLNVAETSIVQLKESSNGVPPKVDAWFMPGNTVGDQFIYDQSGK